MFVLIKRKRFLVTTFLQALGIAREQIVSLFYNFEILMFEKGEFYRKVDDSACLGQRIEKGMLPEKEEKAFLGNRVTKDIIISIGQSWY